MAKKDDKWVMFRNLVFNEMGITKEDIKEWINDIVKEEAKKIVQDAFERENPETIIKRCIYQSGLFERGFNREITDKTAKILAEKIDIKLKNK